MISSPTLFPGNKDHFNALEETQYGTSGSHLVFQNDIIPRSIHASKVKLSTVPIKSLRLATNSNLEAFQSISMPSRFSAASTSNANDLVLASLNTEVYVPVELVPKHSLLDQFHDFVYQGNTLALTNDEHVIFAEQDCRITIDARTDSFTAQSIDCTSRIRQIIVQNDVFAARTCTGLLVGKWNDENIFQGMRSTYKWPGMLTDCAFNNYFNNGEVVAATDQNAFGFLDPASLTPMILKKPGSVANVHDIFHSISYGVNPRNILACSLNALDSYDARAPPYTFSHIFTEPGIFALETNFDNSNMVYISTNHYIYQLDLRNPGSTVVKFPHRHYASPPTHLKYTTVNVAQEQVIFAWADDWNSVHGYRTCQIESISESWEAIYRANTTRYDIPTLFSVYKPETYGIFPEPIRTFSNGQCHPKIHGFDILRSAQDASKYICGFSAEDGAVSLSQVNLETGSSVTPQEKSNPPPAPIPPHAPALHLAVSLNPTSSVGVTHRYEVVDRFLATLPSVTDDQQFPRLYILLLSELYTLFDFAGSKLLSSNIIPYQYEQRYEKTHTRCVLVDLFLLKQTLPGICDSFRHLPTAGPVAYSRMVTKVLKGWKTDNREEEEEVRQVAALPQVETVDIQSLVIPKPLISLTKKSDEVTFNLKKKPKIQGFK